MNIRFIKLPCFPLRRLDRFFLLFSAILLFWTMSRGFRLPVGYVIGQWLLDYGQGFIKRGLVGTLISPLFRYKSPMEIRLIIQTISAATLFATATAFIFVIRALVCKARGGRLLRMLPALVFASSSFLVMMSALNGCFDRFLELLTLAGIWAIIRRRYSVVPFICMTALAVHEMFIVYGFPVIALAAFLQSAEDKATGAISNKRRFFLLGMTVLPSVLFYLSIMFSQIAMPSDQLEELGADIAAYGVFAPQPVHDLVLFHLHNDLVDNYDLQGENTFWPRITNPEIAREVFPSTVFLMLWTVAILWTARRRLVIFPALVVMVAPMVVHLAAWDTHRFSNFTVFQSFAALFAAAAVLKPSIRVSYRAVAVAFALFLPVFVHNLLITVHIGGGNSELDCFFPLRHAPSPASFEGRPRLFPNSDFESGRLRNWRVTGQGMPRKNKSAYNSKSKLRLPMVQGNKWYGTYSSDSRDNRYTGDLPQGEAVSRSFVISQDEILFLVSGGKHPKHTYVALEVEGKEVYRAWGENSDLFRPVVWDVRDYRGRQAVIRIVDKASGAWGHINADGFCYLPT